MAFRSRFVGFLVTFGLAFTATLGGLATLAGMGLSAAVLEAAALALGLITAAVIAALGRANAEPIGDATGERRPASAAIRGLAMATDAVSAPFLLGIAGAVFAWGQDGLAFVLGLGAGILLMQLLTGPSLAQSGARSLTGFIARRFGRAAQLAVAAVVVATMGLLLVAQLTAAGLISARLLGLDLDRAIAVAAVAVLTCFALRGTRAAAWVRALLFPVLLAAFLAPSLDVSLERYGLPVPQIAYANALWQVQGLEETLLEQDLADPTVLKPMLTPFLSLTPLNFIGLVLGLALGLAALPSVLDGHFTQAGARATRSASVWALLFAALLLSALPALAVYARLGVLTLIADRPGFAQLPEWVFTWGRLGLIEICGRGVADAAAAASACAALPEASSPPALALQNLALDPDIVALAAPDILGLGATMLALVAAAVLAAALVTADGPLIAIAAALGWETAAPSSSRRLPYAAAVVAVVVAGLAATTRPASSLTVATWALVLAASGLFPALIGALWWPRANAWGVTAGVLVGAGIATVYLISTHCFPVAFFETFQGLSSAGPMARDTFAELKQAWDAAAAGAARDAAWLALDQHARAIANWWGIKGIAAAVLAVPAAFIALVAVSLAAPAPRAR